MKTDRKPLFSRAAALALAALLSLALLSPAAAYAAEREVIRVGFFALDGYHMQSEDGVRSGYGYELLRLLARYIDVDYEYVGYECGWGDMLDMLANGQLDLVTSAQMTEERLEEFGFSKAVGTSSAMLTTRNDNNAIVAGDYGTYDGIRIGMLVDNSRNEDLKTFAADKGFSFRPVYFSLSSELEQALREGRVDAALTSSLRQTERERILNTFATHDFYIVTRKEDTALLSRINYAIEQLNAVEGDWVNDLDNKYYTHLEEKNLSFTPAERELIRQYADGEKTLVVSACTDKEPYAYVEDGAAAGILFDYFAQLAKYVGIPYTVVTPADREEYIRWCESGLVDICLDGRFQSLHQAETLGRTPSAPYTTMRLAMLTRRDFDGEIETLAVSESQGLFGIEDGLAPNAVRLSVPTREEGMRTVLDGKADAAFVYLYTAQQFVNQDERGILTYTLLSEPTYDYHLSFSENVSHELAGIFTKAIYALPEGSFEQIASQYTSYKAEDVDLITWTQIYPLPTMLVCTAVLALLCAVFLLLRRQKFVQLEKQQAMELREMSAQMEQANRAKSDFLANISHDLRTPMNAIVGVANLMEREPELSDRQRDYIGKIQNASRHLLSLIDDVLDMRTIEAHQIALVPEPISLTAQLRQTADIIQTAVAARGQHFTVEQGQLTHDCVLFDGARLRQVLLNLLSNAVKYTLDGGSITFSLAELPCEEDGQACFRFSVADNGCGMTPQLVARLFEPFARGEASVTNRIQGAGLGMAITKNIVDVMGGEITVDSAPGLGSRFDVTLTMPIAETAPSAPLPAAPEARALEGLRFLCAEDNALNAEILEETLALHGAQCTLCADGSETLNAFTAAPGDYDAILMDIQMPNMDGLEAARAIRSLSIPQAKTVLILAMSANASADDAARSRAAGMDAHLSKPVDVAALAETLERLRRGGANA